MEERIRIFSTKKLRGSLAEALGRRDDLSLEEADFIQITPIPPEGHVILCADTAIVFTSSNAVKHAAAALSHPQALAADIFCLEGATLDAVIRTFGVDHIRGTAADAAALASEIISRKAHKSVSFFCGRQRRDDLPQLLRGSGIEVRELVVYATRPTPQQMAGMPHAVLFFSPSAVDSFFSLNALAPSVVCFAIGETTAAAIRLKTPASIIITAARPLQEAMLEALFNHFQLSSFESIKQ